MFLQIFIYFFADRSKLSHPCHATKDDTMRCVDSTQSEPKEALSFLSINKKFHEFTWRVISCKRPDRSPSARMHTKQKKTALSRQDCLRSNVSSGIQMRAIFVTRQLLKAPRQRDKHLKSCEHLSPRSWVWTQLFWSLHHTGRPTKTFQWNPPVAQTCHGIRWIHLSHGHREKN